MEPTRRARGPGLAELVSRFAQRPGACVTSLLPRAGGAGGGAHRAGHLRQGRQGGRADVQWRAGARAGARCGRRRRARRPGVMPVEQRVGGKEARQPGVRGTLQQTSVVHETTCFGSARQGWRIALASAALVGTGWGHVWQWCGTTRSPGRCCAGNGTPWCYLAQIGGEQHVQEGGSCMHVLGIYARI